MQCRTSGGGGVAGTYKRVFVGRDSASGRQKVEAKVQREFIQLRPVHSLLLFVVFSMPSEASTRTLPTFIYFSTLKFFARRRGRKLPSVSLAEAG